MPRTARVEVAGGIHHVWARGNRRQALYRDDADRLSFLDELHATARHYRWQCLTYCLMTNHLHLVLETPAETLGLGMRRLAGRYAQGFNKRHELVGHLFQGRYGSALVDGDAYFAQILRYVALNPAEAGLCDDATSWRWSSHAALLRGDGASARVEALLEPWGGAAGTRYRRLFDGLHPVAIRYGTAHPAEHRPALAELLSAHDRDAAMCRAREHGYRLTEIAAAVGLDVSTVSRRTRSAANKGSVPGVAR